MSFATPCALTSCRLYVRTDFPIRLLERFSQLIRIHVLLKLDGFAVGERPNMRQLRLERPLVRFADAVVKPKNYDFIAGAKYLVHSNRE